MGPAGLGGGLGGGVSGGVGYGLDMIDCCDDEMVFFS